MQEPQSRDEAMKAKEVSAIQCGNSLPEAICSVGGGPRGAGGGLRSISSRARMNRAPGDTSRRFLEARNGGSFVAHLQLTSRAAGPRESRTTPPAT